MKPIEKKPELYYVFSGRFPSEKAHALYVAKCCEAFSNLGFNVTVVAPNRFRASSLEYQDFYHTEKTFNVVYLPTLDLYRVAIPKIIAFFVSYIIFSIGVFLFFILKNKNRNIIFSNEVMPCLLLSVLGKRAVYEMHDYPERMSQMFGWTFRGVRHILTQNEWKKQKLVSEFGINAEKIFVEQNGVSIEVFDISITKEEARASLGLSQEKFISLYTGHLFDWKGVDVLANSAHYLDNAHQIIFVGGSEHDVVRFKEKYGNLKNICIEGYKSHEVIPLWLKAADCLILPNTAKKDISKYYTSPMKLFEYMASKKPILASDLPSVRSIVSEKEVTFVPPDEERALADAIEELKRNYNAYTQKTTAAFERVIQHTWEKRAKRIEENIISKV